MMRSLLFWLIWLCCAGWTGIYAANAQGVELTGEPRLELLENGVWFHWKTNGVSSGKVRLGTSEDRAQWVTRSGDGVGNEHRVLVEGVKAGELYRFTLGTARRVLFEGAFRIDAYGRVVMEDPKAGAAASPRAPPSMSEAKAKEENTAAAKASQGGGDANKIAQVHPKPGYTPPPVREIWGNLESLQDHYERHGPDFQSKSAEDYARQAWLFLQRAIDEGLPAKLDAEDGTVRVFDPKTGAFAAYRRDGKARTYFKPRSRDYFERQPGNPVRLTRKGGGSGSVR